MAVVIFSLNFANFERLKGRSPPCWEGVGGGGGLHNDT